jgi:hypothetical protein
VYNGFLVGDYMKMMLTGAEIVKNNEKYSIFYKNQLIINNLEKEVAVGIALSSEKLEMLRGNNKNDNIFYLKVA